MKPKKSNYLLRHLLRFASPAIFVTFLSTAHAQNRWWDGGSSDIAGNGNGASAGGAGTWNTTLTNWDAGASAMVAWNNANLNTAVFGGTAGTVTINAPVSAGGLTFTTAGYTVAGTSPNILTLGGTTATITTSSLATTASTTLSTPIEGTLSGGLTIASNGDMSASGGGAAGRGVIFSGTNTFTANITVTAGLFSPGADATLGNAANTITLNGGGLLANVTNTISRNVAYGAANGTIRVYGAQTLTMSGVQTGTGTLTKTDSGILIFNNTSNSRSGATTIGAGELRAVAPTTAGSYTIFGSGAITANSGTTLRFFTGSTANAISYANAINLNGANLIHEDGNHTLTGAVALTGSNTINGIWAGKNLTLSGVISSTGSIIKTNAAANATVLSLSPASGNNTFTGGVTINAGELRGVVPTTAATYTPFGTAAVTANAGTTLRVFTGSTANVLTIANAINLNSATLAHEDGNFTLSGAMVLSGANTVTGRYTGKNLTLSGAISGPGSIIKTNTSANDTVLTLSGNNTFFGGVTVSDGNVRANTATALGSGISILVQNNENPAAVNTNSLQLSGGFVHGSGKTLTLRNNSTTNISNARTTLDNVSGNNTWAGSILLDQGTNQTINSTTGLLTISGNVNQSASPSTGLFVRGNGTGLVTGNLNLGSAALNKTDGGTWTVSSTGNTHGTVTVANGTLIAGATNAFQTSTALILGEGNGNNGRFTINAGFSQSFSAISNDASSTGSHTIDGAGSLDIGAGGLTLTVNDGTAVNDMTLAAPVIGAGTLTKAGAGNLAFNSTTVGPIALTGGTLSGTGTASAITTTTGTTLSPGSPTTVGTLTTSTLSLVDGTVAVNLGNSGTDIISVTAASGLSQSGSTVIAVTPNGAINTASTFYPIFAYSGTAPSTAGFSVTGLPPRAAGTVTDNGSGLIGITATNDRVKWTGVTDGTWDVNTTSNWQTVGGAAPVTYLQNDDLLFDDSGTNTSITLGATVTPSAVEFSNTTAVSYNLAGAGVLSGPMSLNKTGDGTVTLNGTAAHSYTGATNVNAGTLSINTGASTLSGTSGIAVASGATLRLFANNVADYTFSRNLSSVGTVVIDPNASGTAGSRGVTLSGTSTGFSGALQLTPSGDLANNGSFRLVANQAALGSSTITVNDRAQLWPNASITNNITITGYGFQEVAGGVAAAVATGADASSPTLPSGVYAGNSGIGAIRMDTTTISGNITLNGDAKIMPYNTTGILSGTLSNTASTDDLVVGGGGAGTNLVITGDASALERIWVNGGGTAGSNALVIGNNTATGTLGSDAVILYQDAAAGGVRFQRSDGYSLPAGQNIIAAHNGTATNLTRGFVDVNTTGTGLTIGGSGANLIDLSDGTNGGSINVGTNLTGSILNIASGSSVETRFFGLGQGANNSSTVNQTGGTVAINGINTDTANNLRVGHFGTETSIYNLSGGSISFSSTAPATTPSAGGELAGGIYVGIDGQGIFNQSGGTVTTNWVVLDNRGNTAAGTNMTTGIDQYNLTGGLLELKSAYGIIGRNLTTNVNLGGGTIRNTAADSTTVALNSVISTTTSTTTTLDTVNSTRKFSLMNDVTGTGTLLLSGGGTLDLNPDSNTTRTGTSTGTGTQTISAIIDGTSPVVKLGTGTTTLSSASTYSGTTSVNAGRLNLTGSLANSDLTVATGTTLGGEGTAKTLTFGTGTTNLAIDPNTAGALTSTGALTINGTVSVDFTSPPTTTGPVTVMTFGSNPAPFAASNFTLVNAASYRASTFTVNASDVTVDFTKKTLVWDGSGTTWELGGAENDWNGIANDNFFNGDDVVFDQTYITGDQTITTAGTLSPGSITVNSDSYNHTISGAGVITGSTGITKNGLLDLNMGGTHTFTGAITVNNGILRMISAGALGSASANITVVGDGVSGGALDLGNLAANTINLGTRTVTISGVGIGSGAIISTGVNTQQNAFQFVTLANDASIGGTARYDIRGASSILNLNGKKLTKIGSNLVYATVDGTVTSGDVEVNAGTLAFWNGTVQGTGNIQSNVGGSLNVENTVAGKFTRQVTLNGGNLGSTSAATLSGNVVYNASSTINNTADLFLAGTISEVSGPIDLVKTGGGSLVISGTNSLTGKVDVSTGILRVGTDAQLGPVPVSPLSDSIILRSGGRIQGGSTVGNDLTIDSNRGIFLASGDSGLHVWTGFTMNYGGAVSGPGNFSKTDGGTLNFTGTGSYTGSTRATAGTLNFNGATIPTTSSLAVSGGTANLNTGTAITATNAATSGGSVTNFNSGSSFTVNTGGSFSAQGSTVNIASGASVSIPRLVMSDSSGAASTINQTGGTFTITGTDNSDGTSASFLMGHWGNGSNSTYNLSGGSLNAFGAELKPGWDSAAVYFNQTGGILNARGIDLANGRSNAASFNLQAGRVNLGASGIAANGAKQVNLGGGTLGAFANWTGSQPLNLTGVVGSVTFNTLDSVDNTTPRTITQSAVMSGAGGVIKEGAGNLVFSVAQTYTGATMVNGGTLYTGSTLSSSTISVNAGGTLQSGTPALAGTTTLPNLTLNGGSAAFRANFNGGAFGDRFLVSSTNGFRVDAPTALTVIPGSDLFLFDKIPLIDYSGSIGGAAGFAGLTATAAGNPHYILSLENDEVNTVVNVVIEGLDSVVWKGSVNGTWDVNTTANWETFSDAQASNFYSLDVVRFNDDGAAAPLVTLAGTINPFSVQFDAVADYTLQGDPIIGSGTFQKFNTGTVTLLNNNTYAGAVTINGGRVRVGNGGTTGELGGSGNISIGTSGTLEISRSDAQTLTRTAIGGGTLAKSGTGTLTVNSANHVIDFVVNEGTFAPRGGGWATSFAANRTITVNTGGTLDTTTHALGGLGGATRPNNIVINEDAIWKLNNEQQLPNTALTLNAGIVNGPGDVRGGGTIATVAHSTKSSVINAPISTGNGVVTFNTADGDVAADLSVTGAIVGGNAITKIGAGTMVPSGNNSYSGGTNANGGTLEVSSIADAGGVGSIGVYTSGTPGYLGIANDATFRYTGTGSQTSARNLWIDTGAQNKTIEVTSETGSISFTGTGGNINKPFTKTGPGALAIADQIAVGATVTVDAGTLTLTGANTYTGDTIVNGGVLAINGSAINDANKLTINGGKVSPTGNEVVNTLFFGATQQLAGTWGATGSGATFIDDTRFSGTGTVTVISGPPGFVTWAALKGLDGTPGKENGISDDPEKDGINNLLEFYFDGDPLASSPVPLPVADYSDANYLKLTFKRRDDAETDITGQQVQFGTNLTGWVNAAITAADFTYTSGPANGVIITVVENGAAPDDVTISIPRSYQVDGKLFGRVSVTK